MSVKALTNATVFTGERVHENCTVIVEGGEVAELVVNKGPPGSVANVIDLEGRRLAPGFVDLQVNGGGGVLFSNAPCVESLRVIGAAHARFGTTAFLPTLISTEYGTMRDAIGAVQIAKRKQVPGVLGIHLEGPFLSPERSGAHDERMLRRLDAEGMKIITSLNSGLVTLVTLAPDIVEPAEIRRLRAAGVVVFAGHSQASYEQCRAALDAGLSGFTHLFNGMAPVSGRFPGMVVAALGSPDCVFSIIADGVHVHPALLRLALKSRKNGGALLVTDAMPTVGSNNPTFELYGKRIELTQGVLRDGRGSLAGSNLNMIDAVRNTISLAGLDWTEALRMASSEPALAIGVDSRHGFIRLERAADFVELDADMALRRTWIAGVPLDAG